MEFTEYSVCPAKELPPGERVLVAVGDIEIGVFNIGGGFVAYQNRCPHQGGPVCRGRLLGRWVEELSAEKRVIGGHHSTTDIDIVCPWHGWEYDARTGRNIADPSITLRRVEVAVEDGMIIAFVPRQDFVEAVPSHE